MGPSACKAFLLPTKVAKVLFHAGVLACAALIQYLCSFSTFAWFSGHDVPS
jgi:hypothetical protein